MVSHNQLMARRHVDSVQLEFEDEQDRPAKVGTVKAVVQATDWTVETIVNQMVRKNIILNPQFQRRDAWSRARKSLLIESLIVGLPVPQIVLAESKQERGRFLVLDGKQRLLSLLQFWGKAPDPNNAFSLSKLTLRPKLSRKSFDELSTTSAFREDYNALCNQSVRTMVIRSWETDELLHEVFLRLNTGSVKLSPQELRQALYPGTFTNFVDDTSVALGSLQELLNLDQPDPRMRDVEILSRFLAFWFFGASYPGRMKKFLDNTFESLNKSWNSRAKDVNQAVAAFDAGLQSLLELFDGRPARKPGSPHFNRAIFDALIHFHAYPEVRAAIKGKKASVLKHYNQLFTPGSEFAKAVESDTAGLDNTYARFRVWAETLSKTSKTDFTHLIPLTEPKGGPKLSKKTRKKVKRA